VKNKMSKKITGDKAWEAVGQRMSSDEVQEMNTLRAASKTRALTSQEENRLFVLEQKNKTRIRFE